MVRRLIRSGADVNIKDMHGEIALHLSAAKKSPDITQLLIQVCNHSYKKKTDAVGIRYNKGATFLSSPSTIYYHMTLLLFSG